MALNTAKVTRDITLTNGLDFLVLVSYYDSAAPQTELWSEAFVLPLTSSVNDLTNRVIERGQTIRNALAALAAAKASVPVGATVTIP